MAVAEAMGTRVWIGLGSNLGDRRSFLEQAVEGLRDSEGVRLLRVSAWYETAPVGGPAGQGPYLNGVLEAEVELDAHELLRCLAAHDGGPVAIKTIAAVVGETEDTLSDVYEPHLLRHGYLTKTARGRVLTAAGARHLDLEPPSDGGLFD